MNKVVAVLLADDARFELRVERTGAAERFRADWVEPFRLEQEMTASAARPERQPAVADSLNGLFRTLDRQFAALYPDSRDSQGRVVFPWHRFRPEYVDREFAAAICESLLRRLHGLPVEQFIRWHRRSAPAWRDVLRAGD